MFEGLGVIRVDRDSKLLWATHNGAHHDLDVTGAGDVLVLTRQAHVVERVSQHPILEDFVSVLDADTGEEKRRVSLLECFEKAGDRHPWQRAYARFWQLEAVRKLADSQPDDLFHTNSVEWLDGTLAEKVPAFRKGNVLVSMRNLDTIAVLDLDAGEVVWSLTGAFTLQHDPTVTAAGRLLVFDNHKVPNRWSSIVELDPTNGQPLWSWTGSDSMPFYSHSCGALQALPGGNLLITESDAGRVIEIDADGRAVWEYYNPYRAGEHEEYIATLFEVRRVPAELAMGWLEAR
jgi:outer membrane protein assembly factor BamB